MKSLNAKFMHFDGRLIYIFPYFTSHIGEIVINCKNFWLTVYVLLLFYMYIMNGLVLFEIPFRISQRPVLT